jgi:DNA-binding NtrC family response regulator
MNQPSASSCLNNGHVLVVDDDTDIRELMIGQLEREGFAPRAA